MAKSATKSVSKKSATKAATKKVTKAKADYDRPHRWVFDGASKIVVKGDNPAREGSTYFELFEIMKKGGTVEQYRDRAEKADYPINVAQWAMRKALQKGLVTVGGKTDNGGK